MEGYAFATISGNGRLSDFSTILHNNWAYLGSAIATDSQNIYVTGGAPALSTKPYYNYVRYGKLKEDGSLDLASYGSNPYWMQTNRAFHGSVIYNGRLYVLGGWDFSGESNQTVEYGVIQPDHSVGPFQYLTPLPLVALVELCWVSNDRLYYMGQNTYNLQSTFVLRSVIKADGTLSEVDDDSRSLAPLSEKAAYEQSEHDRFSR